MAGFGYVLERGGTEKNVLYSNGKGDYVQGQSVCCGAIKKCMAVVTSNSHRGSPGSISWSNQIYSHLLPRNWRVKTMGERDDEVVCRWCQLKNEGN